MWVTYKSAGGTTLFVVWYISGVGSVVLSGLCLQLKFEDNSRSTENGP